MAFIYSLQTIARSKCIWIDIKAMFMLVVNAIYLTNIFLDFREKLHAVPKLVCHGPSLKILLKRDITPKL